MMRLRRGTGMACMCPPCHKLSRFASYIIYGSSLACCSINVTEVYAGLRSQEETRTKELLESLQYFPIVWGVARMAGLLKRDFARKGITLATTDVTIAAIAIHYQLILITDNLRHYPMKELSIYPLP